MKLCDWREHHFLLSQIEEKTKLNEKVSYPFVILGLTSNPDIQKKSAEIFVNAKPPSASELPNIPKYIRHKKIKVGYFSADFHNHATMHLMAEFFEHHDRNLFETFAFSFGPNTQDKWQKRVFQVFDKLTYVRFQSDRDVALLARSLEIDLAIDLKGFTQDSRTGIFAERAAPIQVNYLGYPGTMGVDYIDYIIADRTLIPEDKQKFYAEKIVYLPDSYQVNCSHREINDKVFTRNDFGLPESGLVFCCFNDSYKITPTTFDSWMRILERVENSVICLMTGNNNAKENLRGEAEARGIDGHRIIFAEHLPIEEHLSRIRLGDLFLDTLPYNAHTTASDALRMGLPVLTCMGESFASRVAASLLNAIHLPELITTSQEEYENLAVELATNPEKLNNIKQKLASNRLSTPLFDTKLFTTNLENAYSQICMNAIRTTFPRETFMLTSGMVIRQI